MNNLALLLILQLLLAHILTDFVFQPTRWVMHKRRLQEKSVFLYLHALLAGLLSYLILRQWNLWVIILIISVSHFFIDLWKLRQKKDTLPIFLLDQVLHLLVVFLVWLYLIDGFANILPVVENIFSSIPFIAIVTSYILIVFPVGFIVGKATKQWQEEIETLTQKSSLKTAGRYIGIFERILVLTFILTHNFAAIGFLIAAKSILRFNEKAETGARKQTEYVLIGTLMSFSITIIIGFLTNYLIFQ